MKINEITRINRDTISGRYDHWALFGKSFYEDLFQKIDNREELQYVYNNRLNNKKLSGKEKDALTFFYRIRRDELDNIFKWNESKKTIKAQYINENISHFKKPESEEDFKDNLIIRNFSCKDLMIEWVFQRLTYILKVEKLPEDIISSDAFYFPEKYSEKILDYIKKYITVRNQPVNIWNSDMKYLRQLVDNKLHENLKFEKIKSEKQFKDKLFPNKIKDALLNDKISYDDYAEEWLQTNTLLANELNFDFDNPSSNDIRSFDLDFYTETYDIDREELMSEFTKKMTKKSNIPGELNVTIGTLRDGSKVLYYQGGLIDGFIARKEWLNENITHFKKPKSEKEFKDSLLGKIKIYYFEKSYMFKSEDFIGSIEAAKEHALKGLQSQYDYRPTDETLWAEINVLEDVPSIGDPNIPVKSWKRADTIIFKN